MSAAPNNSLEPTLLTAETRHYPPRLNQSKETWRSAETHAGPGCQPEYSLDHVERIKQASRAMHESHCV
jgi:hypothetical protein